MLPDSGVHGQYVCKVAKKQFALLLETFLPGDVKDSMLVEREKEFSSKEYCMALERVVLGLERRLEKLGIAEVDVVVVTGR